LFLENGVVIREDFQERPKSLDDCDLECVKFFPRLRRVGVARPKDPWFAPVDVPRRDGNYQKATDKGIQFLANLGELKSLALHDVRLNERGMRVLSGIERLEKLDLSRCSIPEAGFADFSRLRNLHELCLRDTNVSDKALQYISRLDKLELLDLSDTTVGDRGFMLLRAMPKLRLLFLSDTLVTDTGLRLVKDFPSLTYVCLYWSRVSRRTVRDLEIAAPHLHIEFSLGPDSPDEN
jgi:hypothetical protein